jgi:hypothetical protein
MFSGKKILILVGASHMRRLEPVFNMGYTVRLVETDINWRATSKLAVDLLVNIREATGSDSVEDVVVILGVLDNTFFNARFEDGEAIPICKRLDGTYQRMATSSARSWRHPKLPCYSCSL